MKQNGPQCPKPTRLQELANHIAESDTAGVFTPVQEADLLDALEWLQTFLENRNLYHKKQARKNTILRALAKEHGLMDEADGLTRDAVFNIASGGEDGEQ